MTVRTGRQSGAERADEFAKGEQTDNGNGAGGRTVSVYDPHNQPQFPFSSPSRSSPDRTVRSTYKEVYMPITPMGLVPGIERVSEANPATAIQAARALQSIKKKEQPVKQSQTGTETQARSKGKKYDGWA